MATKSTEKVIKKETTKPAETPIDLIKLEEENISLKTSVSEMERKMSELLEQFDKLNKTNETPKNNPIDKIMLENQKIEVISLIDYPLNLTTETHGNGKIYPFPEYGYKHNIKFNDLEDIVHVTRSFAEAGMFYICNSYVVEEVGLEDAYKNILTKDTIDTIVDLNTEKDVQMFAGANDFIKESIVDMMINKINKENKQYDLNLIDKINHIIGKDIIEMAEKKNLMK